MDRGGECHVARLFKEYGDSILDSTFLSRIEEDTGIQANQPLNIEQFVAQQMHPHDSVTPNDTPGTCISWPCQLCIRIVFLVVQSPSIPHMIDQIKSHALSPSNSDSNNFKEERCNDLKDLERLPFVAPLQIKDHPEVSTSQPDSQQNTNQPLTSLTLDETVQLWKSELKTPNRQVKSKELSAAEGLQIETAIDDAVDFVQTKSKVPLMNGNLPRTPSNIGQRASDISLPEIHTNSSGSQGEEEQKTPPTWANTPERNKQLLKQDGRESLRREAFGSPYSKFHLPMKQIFPGSKPKRWARTSSEGKFSNIYSPSPDSGTLLPRQVNAKLSTSARTPSHVRSDNIIRAPNLANTSLAAPPKRGIRPRARKETSSADTGNSKLTDADTIVALSPILQNCETVPQLKVRTLDLAGTGFHAPAKRPLKLHDSQSTQTSSRNSLSSEIDNIKAQITLSVEKFYPMIVFFLPTANATQYLDFNPYSLRAKTTAILTQKKWDALQSQGESISAQIQSSIDDRQLDEVFASDGFTLNDLIPRPGRPVSVRDAISKVQNRKKDVLNMLNWIDYSIARVYESMGEVRKPEYDLDVMNVYLCFWAWFRLLGPTLNGRRQRSWIVLCLRSKVGITRLKSHLNPNHRPISFHILLMQLRTLELPVVEGGDFTPGCRTALDYIKRLLRGSKALNGKIITDDIITNALMWVPPEGYIGGSPLAGLQATLKARPVVLKGVSTSQDVIPDEGVVLSSDPDEESLPKSRRMIDEDDSGFGGTTDRSSDDYVLDDSDHRNSLAREVEKLATQLENCRSQIIADATTTRPFKFYCGSKSIRQLTADSSLEPAVFDIIVALAKPASLEYPTVYLGTFVYPEIVKARFGHSKAWVHHIPRIGVWILPILINGHWRAMMLHWGDKEKKGKRGDVERRSKELELYDPQHHQVGSEAAIRGKKIASRIKEWISHLCDNNECIIWNFKWAIGPVQDRDDSVHCGIYTLQTVCTWYGGRHPVVQLADPIKLRRAFIRRLQEAVDGKKVRIVQHGTRISNARQSDSSYHGQNSYTSIADLSS